MFYMILMPSIFLGFIILNHDLMGYTWHDHYVTFFCPVRHRTKVIDVGHWHNCIDFYLYYFKLTQGAVLHSEISFWISSNTQLTEKFHPFELLQCSCRFFFLVQFIGSSWKFLIRITYFWFSIWLRFSFYRASGKQDNSKRMDDPFEDP